MMTKSDRPLRSALGACAIVWLAMLLVGCSGPKPQAFAGFAAATKSIDASTDKLGESLAELSMARLDDAVADRRLALDALKLDMAKVDGEKDPFTVDAVPNAPYTLRLPAFRAALGSFNRGIIAYASSLEKLADPKLVNDKAIDTMATDANASLRSTRDTLKLKQFENDDIALISTAAAELFRAYLRSSQKSELRAAMTKVQEVMPTVADMGQQAAEIMALAMWQEYDLRAQELRRDHAKPNLSPADNARIVRAFLQLNESHTTQIAALASLAEAYATLPEAHAELIRSLDAPGEPLEAANALLAESKRIESLYQTLKKP